MDNEKLSTTDRILSSALELMKNHGFKSVTIKDIAQASQVSEMTVFRQFETKKGVIEAAIKENTVIPNLRKTFEEKIIWDLEKDIHLIAKTYLSLMEVNQSICLIAVQERHSMPELVELISDSTEQLKTYIAGYFSEMQRQLKMIEVDAYTQSSIFLTMLFGFFISRALWGTKFVNIPKEEFISNSVHSFYKGIKK